MQLRIVAMAVVLLAGCGSGDDDPSNAPPVAVAAADAGAGTAPDDFCFTGRDSTDTDGVVAAWQWDRQASSSMPKQELLADDGATLCIRVERMQPEDPDRHIYAYLLTVTDDLGATNSASVEAWVPENEAPLQGIDIDAGPDQDAVAGQDVLLPGTINAGEFPCNAASCAWEQLTGPEVGLQVTGSCGAGMRYDANFAAAQPAEDEAFLGFRLTAFDATEPGCESRSYVAVKVRPAP
ncbi:MAG: hypothetical protein WC809_03280 [Sinimarinibacterium sp.]|jgi:hypothetical protein